MSDPSPIKPSARNGPRAPHEPALSREVRELLEREFPSQLARLESEVGRRDFMQLMGASLALAGLGSCTRQPDEKILPYASAPESRVPGRPRFYATAMALGGASLGLLVESHEGRPTKVEGNPDHPASLGATDVFAQAVILSLYDPDRSQVALQAGEVATWESFVQSAQEVAGGAAGDGTGVRILTQAVLSPTLGAQLRGYLERHPKARWHQYEPLHADNAHEAARACFGRPVSTRYRFDRAQVVLSLDADFLGSGPNGVRHARDFASGRRVRGASRSMNRLYAVESSLSATGASADHRLALRPSEVEAFARRLARELGMQVDAGAELDAQRLRFVRALARDLREKAGAGVVLAGDSQPPAVHALAHWMNAALGNVGSSVIHSESIEVEPVNGVDSLRELVLAMRAGEVRALFVLDGNPVHDAPADLGFEAAFREVPFRAHLALHEDETSRLCHWHLPMAHFLESWSDARALDGTASIVQPLIAPLYGGRGAHEFIAALDGHAPSNGYELVREHWRARFAEADEKAFEQRWKRALHDGVVAGTELAPLDLSVSDALDLGPAPRPAEGLEIAFRADGCVWDGRFANNAWLQELPRPITRLAWDNALLASPRTAAELGWKSEDVVELALGERILRGPVWITESHPDGTLSLHLGYGREHGGRVLAGVGFDAYPLRTSAAMGFAAGVRATRTASRRLLVSVQDHRRMEGRDLLRNADVARFDELAEREHEGSEAHRASLLPQNEYRDHSWGMVIDLNACIGCNACMVACQSENNVPVVGKDEVANGREMHWLRVDVYHEGEGEDVRVLHQPVPCMHCETAPCELVCPVGATVHSDEGLNDMVYNRCVGTRYCSNNCPYKVRRFNFFHYSKTTDEVLTLGRNPDVTVRFRGVMEKCTYCVQRINRSKIQAQLEERPLRDGDVVPACAQSCPAQAIVFGDLKDERSAVSELRREPHHYGLLAELGTRPHTTYLARLRNPNPELERGA